MDRWFSDCWVYYKIDNPGEQRIPEYEQKLKTCQVYLDVMAETMLDNTGGAQDFGDEETQLALVESVKDFPALGTVQK